MRQRVSPLSPSLLLCASCSTIYTADEYRKTIGKDAALERRFQPVTIDEPTVDATISILRGLKPRYEVHHGVGIADSALVTAAVYASRYISDRFLPDKAIDLVDEAASALRLAQESKPDELEKLDREIMTLEIERESLRHETDVFSAERRASVEAQLQQKRAEAEQLTAVWQAERARLDKIKETKERLDEAKRELEIAQRQGQYEKASRLRFATIPELEKQLPAEGERGESEDAEGPLAMLHDRVTSADIARVVAKATGIPVQSLLKGEREKLVHVRFPCLYVVSLCEEAYCFCVDGGCAQEASRRSRSRRRGCQRRRPNFSRGLTGAQPPCRIFPLPWTNWCRQGTFVPHGPLIYLFRGAHARLRWTDGDVQGASSVPVQRRTARPVRVLTPPRHLLILLERFD